VRASPRAAADTLASIAGQVFPEDRAARLQYLAALREANPDLERAGDGPLPEGASVALPDLRTYARLVTPTATPTPVPKAIAAQQPPPVSRHAATGAFVLKLSGPDVDLARSRGMDERNARAASPAPRAARRGRSRRNTAVAAQQRAAARVARGGAAAQARVHAVRAGEAGRAGGQPGPVGQGRAREPGRRCSATRAADDAPWWKGYLANPWRGDCW